MINKIFLAFAIFGLLFITTGCSSDHSVPLTPHQEPTTKELLIGTWKVKEEGSIINGIKQIHELTECITKDTYTYNKNLKFIIR